MLIGGAGVAAHLAGVLAAHTTLPVIGVPLSGGIANGLDALLATVQMPSGIPVATVAVDGSKNAGILAAQIIAVTDADVAKKLDEFKAGRRALIGRYTRPQMAARFDDVARFHAWLEVEILAVEGVGARSA